jgi:spermidine/putrescine transport system substrate-binding protein
MVFSNVSLRRSQPILTRPATSTAGRLRFGVFLATFAVTLLGCSPTVSTSAPPTAQPPVSGLSFYGWPDYIPQSVLEAFEVEYGIEVVASSYTDADEAIAAMRGTPSYDVVLLDNDYIPEVIQAGLLAPLNYENLPNFRNVSANFRNLVHDPDNRYTIPFHWGTTGILVRTDLVPDPVRNWDALWDPRYAGKVGIWEFQSYMINIALKSLGYSINSEDPAELEAALEHLRTLRANATIIDPSLATSIGLLESGELTLAYGWVYDLFAASDPSLPIEYVIPEDGALLWGDNLVIPANSAHQASAELFLNFLLRPDISAANVVATGYATTVEGVQDLVPAEIRNNLAIFPTETMLQNAEIGLPLSAEGYALRQAIWQRYEEGDAP